MNHAATVKAAAHLSRRLVAAVATVLAVAATLGALTVYIAGDREPLPEWNWSDPPRIWTLGQGTQTAPLALSGTTQRCTVQVWANMSDGRPARFAVTLNGKFKGGQASDRLLFVDTVAAEGRWHADIWPRGGDYVVEVQAADASNWRIECEVPFRMSSRSAPSEGGMLAV